MKDNLVFCFPIGGSEYAEKSLYLARSLREIYGNKIEIVTGVSQRDQSNVEEEILNEIRDITQTVSIDFLEEYPISMKTSTMKAASEKTNQDLIVHIDSDSIVLNEIHTFFQEGGNFFQAKRKNAKDIDILEEDRQEFWENLYRDLPYGFPGYINETINGDKIPPFYNAFVVAGCKEFCQRWHELTIYSYRKTESRYSDQIALGMASQEFEYLPLSQDIVCGMPYRWNIEKPRNILSYQDFFQIIKIKDEECLSFMEDIGLSLKEKYPHPLTRIWVYIYAFHDLLSFKLPYYGELKYQLDKRVLQKLGLVLN